MPTYEELITAESRGRFADDATGRNAALDILLAEGWTVNGALNHLEGACDRAICCGWDDES